MRTIIILASFLLLSCSGDYKYNDKERIEILLDGIAYENDLMNIYPFELLYMNEKRVFIEQLNDSNYLQDFFWIINTDTNIDTIRRYKVQTPISPGEFFFKLVLVDVWGDTLSDSFSITVTEW
ncbi:MAG: hypothetical protein LBC85_05390 [Fibromonadaceae bacterium]|jgi:hypothetical protein|nr:hypothetical protein [Fibromonadaceae bacterium]